MKKLFFQLAAVTMMTIMAGSISCTKEFTEGLKTGGELKNGAIIGTPIECGQQQAFAFIAGQKLNTGYIYVSNDDENIKVTYSVQFGWELTEAHLFVGNINDLPRNKPGIPMPGKFPYSVEDLPEETTEYTFTIPLSDLPDQECLAIVPHGVVEIQGYDETAWLVDISFKEAFGIKRWGGYAEYCPVECEDECEMEVNGWVSGTKLRNATDDEGNNLGFELGMFNEIIPQDGESLEKKLFGSDIYAGKTTGKMEVHISDGKMLVTFDDESMMSGDNYKVNFSKILFYAGSFSDLKENYYSESQDLLYMNFPYRFDWTENRPSSFSFEIDLDEIPTNSDGTITLIGKAFFCIEEIETE